MATRTKTNKLVAAVNQKIKAKSKKPKRDLYQETTDRIIALLEKGVLPWRRTWSQYGLARNYFTKNIYKGINAILMNNSEYPIPYFLSMKQANKLGGKVKKGAKADTVLCFKLTFKDETGKIITQEQATALKAAGQEVQTLRLLRYFNVFNISKIEGIDFKIPEVQLKDNEQIAKCENIIENMPNPPAIETVKADRAFYSPNLDRVNVPSIQQFENSSEYYCTLFHELTHATGHPNRLNRKGISELTFFGTKQYSKEELIAEMGAAFLSAHAGIDYEAITENSAAYIQGWLKVLKEDKHFIFGSAAQAQKAVDYILG